MRKKYIVRLAGAERDELTKLVTKGETLAYKIRRANILLKADVNGPAWDDAKISEAFSVNINTVANTRRRFIEEGLEAALKWRNVASLPNPPKFDGESEARLIALCCSKPPEGYAHWTLRILADRVVALDIVKDVSHETIRNVLKKTNLNRSYMRNG